jgi:hypothetical protein
MRDDLRAKTKPFQNTAVIWNNELFRLVEKERSVIVGDLQWNEPASVVYEDRKISNEINNDQVYISWFKTFAVFWMLCVLFWVIPRRLNLYADVSEHCPFHLYRQVGTYPPMKIEQTC